MGTELDFVRKLARAFAFVNGHSHPDDYAAAVVAAHDAQTDADEQAQPAAPASNGTAAETPAATSSTGEPAQDAPAPTAPAQEG